MVFVTQKNSIDSGKSIERDCWVIGEAEGGGRVRIFGAGGCEDGVGDELYTVDVNYGSCSSDMSDLERALEAVRGRHVGLLS
jgi:hypothetical protein